MNPFVIALHGLVAMGDPTPADRDVKAGWGAFALFVGLAIAVGLLCWSMYRHLKKVDVNAEAGVYGDKDSTKS